MGIFTLSPRYEKANNAVAEKYDVPCEMGGVLGWMDYPTKVLQVLEPTAENWQGKRVLDLGCGCTDYMLQEHYLESQHDGYAKNLTETYEHIWVEMKRLFEPWMSRLLHELEVDVMGVDLADNSGEEFVSVQLDVLEKPSLVQSVGEGFSVVIMNNFFPLRETRDKAIASGGMAPSVAKRIHSEELYVQFSDWLRAELASVLAESGVLFADQRLWRKTNGALQRESLRTEAE